MFVVNLQVALFFNSIIDRPDQLGHRVNARMGNIFDGIPNSVNLPPDVPADIPLMQMCSTTSGNRLNVSRGRIDLFINANPTAKTSLDSFISEQEELVYLFFSAIQEENFTKNRLGLILTAFDEDESPIDYISDKYLSSKLSSSSELYLRVNTPRMTKKNIMLNNIIEITSGHLTNDVLGLNQAGIIYKRDLNNVPQQGEILTNSQLKEIWRYGKQVFTCKKMAEVV